METKTMVVWIVGLFCVLTMAVAPVACTMNRQQIISTAIKGGADPISVKCAIESDMNNQSSAMCIVKALEKR